MSAVARVRLRASINLSTAVLAFLGLSIAVAVACGLRPALLSTIIGFGLLNWFFTPPLGTFTIGEPENIVTLAFFVVVTATVGTFVDRAGTRGRDAARARAEAEALARSSAAFVESEEPLPLLLDHVRTTFGFERVTLLELATQRIVMTSPATEAAGSPYPDASMRPLPQTGHGVARMPLGRSRGTPTHEMVVEGPMLTADQRRVLEVLADHVAVAVEGRETRAEAARVATLEGVDAVRTAILRSVSHDLRTPLATIKAYVSGLRQPEVHWSDDDLHDMYAQIDSETDRLDRLVANLLDASRLEAGVLAVYPQPTALEEPITAAVRSVGSNTATVPVRVDAAVPLVTTDPTLLERAIANLIANALRHGGESPVRVDCVAAYTPGSVEIRVVDHGRGIDPTKRVAVVEPFQRLGDGNAGTGVGLGLAITQGIVRALGGSLRLDDTPGGGLTATIQLPVDPGVEAVAL